MRNFIRQSYYSYRGLYTWLPPSSYVTMVIMGPAFMIIMFSLVGRFALGQGALRPYVLGMVAQYIPFMLCAGVVNCLAHERGFATLSLVYASRANRAVVFFSRQLFHLPNAFAVVATGLFFSWALLGLDFGQVNWLAFIASILAITLSSCAAGGFIANFTIVMNDWILLYRLFAGGILVLTGAIIPLSSLPAPLAAFSHALPLTSGIVAFKGAFDGAGLASLWPYLARELAVAAGYAVVGTAGYYFVEAFAKRRGIAETAA